MTQPDALTIELCGHVCARCGACPDCCECTTGDLLKDAIRPDRPTGGELPR